MTRTRREGTRRAGTTSGSSSKAGKSSSCSRYVWKDCSIVSTSPDCLRRLQIIMRAKSEGWDAPFSGKLTAEKAASTAYRRSYVTVWQRSALQRIAVAALHFNARVGNEEYSIKEASRKNGQTSRVLMIATAGLSL